ncbi:hypothetical protein Tco_1439937 [Tanacetum coccineum]
MRLRCRGGSGSIRGKRRAGIATPNSNVGAGEDTREEASRWRGAGAMLEHGGLEIETSPFEKVASEDNIADILSLPLNRESSNCLCLGLGMMEHIP